MTLQSFSIVNEKIIKISNKMERILKLDEETINSREKNIPASGFNYNLDEVLEFLLMTTTNRRFFDDIRENKELLLWLYNNVNVITSSGYSLGLIILLDIIDMGRSVYDFSQLNKSILFNIIKLTDNICIEQILDDQGNDGNGNSNLYVSVGNEFVDSLKAKSDILLIISLLKGLNIGNKYHEYDYVMALNESYLHTDEGNDYICKEYKQELLIKSLNDFQKKNTLDKFDLNSYRKYLAFLSLLKYYINIDTSIRDFYRLYLSNYYRT